MATQGAHFRVSSVPGEAHHVDGFSRAGQSSVRLGAAAVMSANPHAPVQLAGAVVAGATSMRHAASGAFAAYSPFSNAVCAYCLTLESFITETVAMWVTGTCHCACAASAGLVLNASALALTMLSLNDHWHHGKKIMFALFLYVVLLTKR